MNGSVHDGRLSADVLHHIDLAACGPAGYPNIATEHPECGPEALTVGDLHARFDLPVREGELALCLDASRSVGGAVVEDLNHEMTSTILKNVAGIARVRFEFVIAPASGA